MNITACRNKMCKESRGDRGRLLYEVSCQKAYNSINICQKILFFLL